MSIVKVLPCLALSYLLQGRADAYFGCERHDLTAPGFSLVLTSAELFTFDLIQHFQRQKSVMQLCKKQYPAKSKEYCERERSYGCSPQQMDAIFLFDFG